MKLLLITVSFTQALQTIWFTKWSEIREKCMDLVKYSNTDSLPLQYTDLLCLHVFLTPPRHALSVEKTRQLGLAFG